MSSAGAQAVVVAWPLACRVGRPRARASIGLIWAISSWAVRRSWNGSHRVMVVIWSPRVLGRVAWWLGEDAGQVAAQRALAELNYVHNRLNAVHLSRSAFNEDGRLALGWSRWGSPPRPPAARPPAMR